MLKVIDTVENKTIGYVPFRKSAERIVAKYVAQTGAPASRFVIEEVRVSSTNHVTSQIS